MGHCVDRSPKKIQYQGSTLVFKYKVETLHRQYFRKHRGARRGRQNSSWRINDAAAGWLWIRNLPDAVDADV